jgi:hypothetical protein
MLMDNGAPTPDDKPDLQSVLSAILNGDYAPLSARLRDLQHTVTCECAGTTIRLYYPSFRQGKATVYELIEVIYHYLPTFCLPRTQVQELQSKYGVLPVQEYDLLRQRLFEEAKDLFIKANKATNRNGEAGELLLYLLTEWVLGAPQIIAKMSLKTSASMPVHGADGVHIKFCPETSRIILYWGESKLYADVGAAIKAAIESIASALQPDKLKHELQLVQRNMTFSGLDASAKDALLKYLDPFDETYNERHDVSTCLIGFDFDAFATNLGKTDTEVDAEFEKLAVAQLTALAPKLAETLKANGLVNAPVEVFFLPVPSVADMRGLFQSKIGWKE